jgi:hypothetical protein
VASKNVRGRHLDLKKALGSRLSDCSIYQRKIYGERRPAMAKKKGVSGKTHTQKQLDDYANCALPEKTDKKRTRKTE